MLNSPFKVIKRAGSRSSGINVPRLTDRLVLEIRDRSGALYDRTPTQGQ